MATVKELKEWLDRFPDDTIVEVGIQGNSRGYESYEEVIFKSPELKDSDSGDGWDFVDFRNNAVTKPHELHYGKCYLILGEKA